VTESTALDLQRSHDHEVDITIDGSPYTVDEREMTVRELLALAGKDPVTFYLVQIVGKKERVSYKDKPDEEIKLHEKSKFITVSTGETPVS
jgi:hypothetical protein